MVCYERALKLLKLNVSAQESNDMAKLCIQVYVQYQY